MSNGITPSTQPNKNLYNGGSEWQNDYSDLPDYYATFYRNYDAAVGRFTGVDPQALSADSWTIYQYAYNNPGMLNDPLGDLAGRPIFPDYMNGMYSNQENAPVAANFLRSYQYTNDDLANLDAFHTQIERETVQNFSSQLDVLRGYFGVAKSPNGLVRYYDEEGNLNNILESNLPGNMSRQDFRVSDTRIEVRTISEDGPNAANPFWVEADKKIAKGIDLAAPIYYAAEFYAGGEIGGAIIGWALKGTVSLAGRYILNKAVKNPIFKGGEEWGCKMCREYRH